MTTPMSPIELMLSGTGPGAYADRADAPDLTIDGEARIVPMSLANGFFVEPRDPDPRGYQVVGHDGVSGGTVVELWVDRSEPQLRFLDVELLSGDGRVLVPVTMARMNPKRREVMVRSVLGEHFRGVPRTARNDRVTLREEDQIMAFFAAGTLYATPSRRGPLL